MTRTQALNFIAQSHKQGKQETAGLVELSLLKDSRYIVVNVAGIVKVRTNDCVFARMAVLNLGRGSQMYDKTNWRN